MPSIAYAWWYDPWYLWDMLYRAHMNHSCVVNETKLQHVSLPFPSRNCLTVFASRQSSPMKRTPPVTTTQNKDFLRSIRDRSREVLSIVYSPTQRDCVAFYLYLLRYKKSAKETIYRTINCPLSRYRLDISFFLFIIDFPIMHSAVCRYA